ncbi:hypothetical protein ACFCXS_15375 [Streptomyces sp. NPDC056373]|uniref:hypothetical protein n=1 Tax=Streptomyces sp. NPDC056373 TaxID=3345798 RepID=UPI0035D8AF70
MARNIGADGRTVFRAVITFGNSTTPRYEGPYSSAGGARARVSFWRNHLARSEGSATGRVEQAHTVWTPVGEQADPIAAAIARAYRAVADEINALPQDYECDPGRGDAAEYLRRRADEIHPAAEEPNQ